MAIDNYTTDGRLENTTGDVSFQINPSTGELEVVSSKDISNLSVFEDQIGPNPYSVRGVNDIDEGAALLRVVSTPTNPNGSVLIFSADQDSTSDPFTLYIQNDLTENVKLEFSLFFNDSLVLPNEVAIPGDGTISVKRGGTVTLLRRDNYEWEIRGDFIIPGVTVTPPTKITIDPTTPGYPEYEATSLPSGDVIFEVSGDLNTTNPSTEKVGIGTIGIDTNNAGTQPDGKVISVENSSPNAVYFISSTLPDLESPDFLVPPYGTAKFEVQSDKMEYVSGDVSSILCEFVQEDNTGFFSDARAAMYGRYILRDNPSGNFVVFNIETSQRILETDEISPFSYEKTAFIKNQILYASNGSNVDLYRFDLEDINPSTGLVDVPSSPLIDFNRINNLNGSTSLRHVDATIGPNGDELVYFVDEINTLIRYNYDTDTLTELPNYFSQLDDYRQAQNLVIDGNFLYIYASSGGFGNDDGFLVVFDIAEDDGTTTQNALYEIPIPVGSSWSSNFSNIVGEFEGSKYLASGTVTEPIKGNSENVLPQVYDGLISNRIYRKGSFYYDSGDAIKYNQPYPGDIVYPFYTVLPTNTSSFIINYKILGEYRGELYGVDGGNIIKFEAEIPGKR